MTARAVVERMMVGCEAASGNPWWCRVHESRIRFHVNPPTGGANDCDNFRDALDLAEEVQEKVLADLRAQVEGLTQHASADDGCWCLPTDDVLAMFDEAGPDETSLLSDYDPVPGLVARGVMSDEHDPVSCEMDCCRLAGPQ